MDKERLKKLGLNLRVDRNIAELILTVRNGLTNGFNHKQLEILTILKDAIEEYEGTITQTTNLPVVTPVIAAQHLFPYLRLLDHEETCVMFLTKSKRLISTETITKGGFHVTIIDIKQILSKALQLRADAIILAHNHPNGDPRPSKSDIAETQRIKMACGALDIELTDHIIIADTSWFSFTDEVCHAIETKEKKN